MPTTWNWVRPSARREAGGSSEEMSLTTMRKPACTPRASFAAVSVNRLPSKLARTPELPMLSTERMVGSGSATPPVR